MRVFQQPGFVLHKRAYRESSLLLEVFTRDFGRVGLVAKGARRANSRLRMVMTLFQPLLVSWSGKGELVTLTGAEAAGAFVIVEGDALYSAFYLNELLLRLLHRHDPHEILFAVYKNVMIGFNTGKSEEWTLRIFEKHLLKEIGYGLVLDHDIVTRAPVAAEGLYDYILDRGPVIVNEHTVNADTAVRLQGRSLLALASEVLPDAACRHDIKKLMRALISQHLEGKPLQTRKLMQSVRATVHGSSIQ